MIDPSRDLSIAGRERAAGLSLVISLVQDLQQVFSTRSVVISRSKSFFSLMAHELPQHILPKEYVAPNRGRGPEDMPGSDRADKLAIAYCSQSH
jgi:hypothetical protein